MCSKKKQACKPGSVSLPKKPGWTPIIYLALPLLTGSNDLPILKNERATLPIAIGTGLFGLSTPGVYRDPGHPEKL
jgi:hypothetical protein